MRELLEFSRISIIWQKLLNQYSDENTEIIPFEFPIPHFWGGQLCTLTFSTHIYPRLRSAHMCAASIEGNEFALPCYTVCNIKDKSADELEGETASDV